MKSSASISRYYLLNFAGVFLILLCLITGLNYGAGGPTIWHFSRGLNPPSSDYIFSANRTTYSYIDHLIYYYGFGSAIDNARKAEILFVGNSRTIYGIDQELMQKFCARYGATYFNMAFGAGTGLLPRKLIAKYQMRPRLLIVNYNDFFYENTPSNVLTDMALGRWKAFKLLLSEHAKVRLSMIVQEILPASWMKSLKWPRYEPILYRSVKNGQWYRVNLIDAKIPITGVHQDPPSEHEMSEAGKFLKEMADRNIRVAFIYVPTTGGSPDTAKIVAQKWGVPYWEISEKGLITIDSSHLNAESARLYTTELIQQMAQEPLFNMLFSPK